MSVSAQGIGVSQTGQLLINRDCVHLPITDELFRCELNRKESKLERERLFTAGMLAGHENAAVFDLTADPLVSQVLRFTLLWRMPFDIRQPVARRKALKIH